MPAAQDRNDSSLPPAPESSARRVYALADDAASVAFGTRLAIALQHWQRRRGEDASHAAHIPPTPRPRRALQWQLQGDLGAGKTTLVRAVLRALGYTARVRSPTYTLLEHYTLPLEGGALDIYHFDLYRLAAAEEWLEAGFDEYLDAPGVVLIEWPEMAGALLGQPDLKLVFEIVGEARRLTLESFSPSGRICLEDVDQAV